MPYNVELCYGYFEGECGIYHAFRLVAPEKDFPDDVEKSLAESLETKADNPNFKWDCMHLNLPDAIVERIKADGVREYLTAQKGEPRDIQRSVDQQNDHARGTYQTKYIRVLGHAEVTVSVRIKVRDDETLSEQDIYARCSLLLDLGFLGLGGSLLGGGYFLDLHEVLHARNHTFYDHRVVVLDARVDPFQTQRVKVLALTLRGADAAFDLGDFQSCHVLLEN